MRYTFIQREVNLYPDEFDLAVWECALRSGQKVLFSHSYRSA